MTCIAYRDGLLAVDRQITHCGLIEQTDDKIFVIDETTVMAFAGLVAMGYAFKRWCADGYNREEWLFSTEIPARSGFVAVVYHTDTQTLDYWDDVLLPIPLDPKNYHGYGSGREIALGAMHYGANPLSAVRAANKHLDDCGFGICYVDGNKEKLKIKRVVPVSAVRRDT